MKSFDPNKLLISLEWETIQTYNMIKC